MSVIKFELKEEHVKLIRQLGWSFNSENQIVALGHDGVENLPPFGENNIYDAIDLILHGLPEDFDPFNTEDIKEYSEEQKAEWDKLYEELPTALDIIMYNGHFELGTYKTKYHDRQWKKLN
jgi:hypothetical protein